MTPTITVTDEGAFYMVQAFIDRMSLGDIVAYATTAVVPGDLAVATYASTAAFRDTQHKSTGQPDWTGPSYNTDGAGEVRACIQASNFAVENTGPLAILPTGIIVVDETEGVLLMVANSWTYGLLFPGNPVFVFPTIYFDGLRA